MDPNKLYKLFAYGTLRQGHGNHGFLRRATLIGRGTTVEPVALAILGACGLPVAYPTSSGPVLTGELYELPLSQLDPIHTMECMAGYEAKWHSVNLDTGELHRAIIYVFNPGTRVCVVASGDYNQR